jgi:signal transduction histidine kinase
MNVFKKSFVVVVFILLSAFVYGQFSEPDYKFKPKFFEELGQDTKEQDLLNFLDDFVILVSKSRLPLREALRCQEDLQLFFDEHPKFEKHRYMLDLLGIVIANNRKDSVAYQTQLDAARQTLIASARTNELIRFDLELAHHLISTGKIRDGLKAHLEVEQIVAKHGFENLNKNGKLYALINANSFGLYFLNTLKYDSAELYYLIGLNRAKLLTNEVWQGIISGNLALVLLKKGKHKEAKVLLLNDYYHSSANGEVGSAIHALFSLADVEIANNRPVQAKAFLDTAIIELKRVGEDDVEFRIDFDFEMRFRLGKLAQTTGKHKEALDYYDEFYRVVSADHDKLHAQLKAKNADRYFIEDNAYKVVYLEEQQTRNLFLIGVFISLFILAIVLLVLLRRFNTQLSQKNLKIEAQAHRLELLNQQKNKLFSVVAHDLRGPLGILTRLLEMYKEKDITEEELISYNAKVSSSLESLNIMLDNLLHWARAGMENGLQTEFIQTDIVLLSKDVINQVQPQTTNKSIQVSLLGDAQLQLITDPALLTVVLRNLLNNAIKFSNENGKIELSIQKNKANNRVEIDVKDFGVGMTEDDLAKILSTTSGVFSLAGTNGEKGSGLGLMICRDFTEALKGQLSATSELGLGTTFTVSLPGDPIEN